MDPELQARQRELCRRFGAEFLEARLTLKVGLGGPVGAWPMHGLRHPPEGDTTGWYLWTGELLAEADFFRPVHLSHLADLMAEALPYLGLGPGWRVLLAPGHEDVWFDPSLLTVGDWAGRRP